MGEPPQAVVMKNFGEQDETCEEKIQSHLQCLRKVLAEFLDWKVSEEKRHQDYLVQEVPSVLQQSEWVFGYLFFPKPLLKKHMGSRPRGILTPCKALHPVGVVGADPGQVWQVPTSMCSCLLSTLEISLMEMSEAERRRIQAEFERLRRLLAEQERTVLGRLAELDDTFAATHAEKSLRVAEGVAQLHRLIAQLEARSLPQDVGSILSSEMSLHLPSGLPEELEKSLSSCCRQSDALWEALEKFRDTDSPMSLPTAKTTLETGTTPLPQLLAERKRVRWDEEEEQDEAREPR